MIPWRPCWHQGPHVAEIDLHFWLSYLCLTNELGFKFVTKSDMCLSSTLLLKGVGGKAAVQWLRLSPTVNILNRTSLNTCINIPEEKFLQAAFLAEAMGGIVLIHH